MQALTDITLTGLDVFTTGKVREVYDLGDNLLIVSTDRISAFDCVLPVGIPDKGKILNTLSVFWFRKLESLCPNHLITSNVDEFPAEVEQYKDVIRDRSMLVRKARRIDVECIVRGYVSGFAWKQYSETGKVAEFKLPPGLEKNQKLERPLFTPTTKATGGHDRPITIRQMCEMVGSTQTEYIIAKSLSLYEEAWRYASEHGIVVVDTKFEFGYLDDEIILIDEILTPDSSRFLLESDTEGVINLDKQFIRDFLETTGWDKDSAPPNLPDDVVLECRRRYLLLLEKLMGGLPRWVA